MRHTNLSVNSYVDASQQLTTNFDEVVTCAQRSRMIPRNYERQYIKREPINEKEGQDKKNLSILPQSMLEGKTKSSFEILSIFEL